MGVNVVGIGCVRLMYDNIAITHSIWAFRPRAIFREKLYFFRSILCIYKINTNFDMEVHMTRNYTKE